MKWGHYTKRVAAYLITSHRSNAWRLGLAMIQKMIGLQSPAAYVLFISA